MQALIDEFLSSDTFVVAGSFRSERKFAYQILQRLLSKGKTVFPIHPSLKQIEGLVCYKTILELPVPVAAASVVTPPLVTGTIVRQCHEKGINLVWMQPGAESITAIDFCRQHNMKAIYNTCLLTND